MWGRRGRGSTGPMACKTKDRQTRRRQKASYIALVVANGVKLLFIKYGVNNNYSGYQPKIILTVVSELGDCVSSF